MAEEVRKKSHIVVDGRFWNLDSLLFRLLFLFGARQKKQKKNKTKSEQLEAQTNLREREKRAIDVEDLRALSRETKRAETKKTNAGFPSFQTARSKRLQNDRMEKITKQPHLTRAKNRPCQNIF